MACWLQVLVGIHVLVGGFAHGVCVCVCLCVKENVCFVERSSLRSLCRKCARHWVGHKQNITFSPLEALSVVTTKVFFFGVGGGPEPVQFGLPLPLTEMTVERYLNVLRTFPPALIPKAQP